jgi:hypothetical protein
MLTGFSSPANLRIGGTTTNMTGAIPATTQLQKMAGFSCDAHLKYLIGEPQKFFGIAADMAQNGN